MKKNKHLLYISIIVILISSCYSLHPKTIRAHSIENKEPFLIITPILSLGVNPISSLWIDKNGNAEYISHYYSSRLGLFTKKLSQKQMQFIEDLMQTELGDAQELVEKLQGNEEIQPCTIFWYKNGNQKKMKTKKGSLIAKAIMEQIETDNLDKWNYINGMGNTTLQVKRWNADSSYFLLSYSSMGNVINIANYDQTGKRLSQRFQHNLTAIDVYQLFENISLYIKEDTLNKTSETKKLYEITGKLEVNPEGTIDNHKYKKVSSVKYEINYYSNLKSIPKVNEEIDVVIQKVVKK